MKEQIAKIKETLKTFITSENAEVFANISSDLDSCINEHEQLQTENGKLKDRIVDIVSKTSFSKPSEDEIAPTNLTLDDALQQALKNMKK